MAMVVVDDSCLQADSQPKSGCLVWGSTAACAVRCAAFIKWTEWTLAMTFSGHDDSTINIVLGLLLFIINYQPGQCSGCVWVDISNQVRLSGLAALRSSKTCHPGGSQFTLCFLSAHCICSLYLTSTHSQVVLHFQVLHFQRPRCRSAVLICNRSPGFKH